VAAIRLDRRTDDDGKRCPNGQRHANFVGYAHDAEYLEEYGHYDRAAPEAEGTSKDIATPVTNIVATSRVISLVRNTVPSGR
jgi:hypothetical protein